MPTPTKKEKKLDLPEVIDKQFNKLQREMKTVQKDTTSARVRNERVLKDLKNYLERADYVMEQFEKRIEGFEDSLLHIMHNIKKNQFLYAHYPEEWVHDYLSIKEGLKFENERMDKIAQNQ